MDKNTILKIVGVGSIVVGSVCLFISGSGAELVTTLVGGVFVLAGMILAFFKK